MSQGLNSAGFPGIAPGRERLGSLGGRHKMDVLLVVLVLIGTGLRLWQYIANTSLWLDEILLASNILHRSMRDLLILPLSYSQMAPKGFLFLEKLATLSLGRSDYVLRLVPQLCSLAALAGFWRIVRRILRGLAAPIALALFATAAPLVAFGSEVKQYSVDVAVAVFLLWLSLDLAGRDLTLRRALWAGIAGAASVWFSQPAVLVVFALAISLAVIAWSAPSALRIRRLLSLVPMLAMWGVSALAATFVALASMTPDTLKFMRLFWAPGLLPINRWQEYETLWPLDQLRALTGVGGQASLGYLLPECYLLLAAFGFWLLWRRLGIVVALFMAPIAVTLAAAVARQYPFSDRLILFLVPNFFVAIATPIEWIYCKVASSSLYAGWLVAIVLLGPAFYPMVLLPPPYRVEDMKSVISHLQGKWRPGDTVYLYYNGSLPFIFYSKDYGFDNKDYKVGRCHRGDNRGYFEELDMFRGCPRLWVVLTHAWPSFKERDDILHYLDTIGLRRDDFAVQSRFVGNWGLPAEVLLYDLSDTRRLGNTSAASFSLMGTKSPSPLQGCGEGPLVMVPPRSP
ncbi:MAG TPA: glycosyltransferase family 39 protein [Candidatus Acidoferrum sp.]